MELAQRKTKKKYGNHFKMSSLLFSFEFTKKSKVVREVINIDIETMCEIEYN